ncbi:hypothetical protein DRV85_14950 [Rhodosalinus halophilus]|uniref:Uncharacterized protein n=1 Tax=Rhodosalinus halophilus TaxID=2259333 RepID=A0A365U688_9RHOB|nr:hypothetical protein DRV85_14950 [Rhodosalinus halophilus]
MRAGAATLHAPHLPRFPDTARPTRAAQAATLLAWLDRMPAPVHLGGHSHGARWRSISRCAVPKGLQASLSTNRPPFICCAAAASRANARFGT